MLNELIGKDVEEKSLLFKVLIFNPFSAPQTSSKLLRNITAVICKDNTKIYCAENTELLVLRPVVPAATTVIYGVKIV
jgi:hypothetical protein